MDNASLFSTVNTIALVSWVVLLIFPFSQLVKKLLLGIVVVGLAILYVFLITQTFDADAMESFGSLSGIATMFQNEIALLAGWVHYLAFDLMVGLFITNNAQKYGVNRFILIPCLFLTFMLGPTGLLLYIIIRSIYTKRYFEDYQ
ncbi:ABA4-like family protein [Marivirga atlantica]|jgi:hypothetical protein|uniref:DUF4281 domain-containing protein n=1 Tax=Marivirga atlantica TaxID=1548457 RepID=A0A937DI55_9BACT|nr:ABA4-like family protein [Marivirga atlantica]MBL0766638.1 DUF4281 domain-containing protein [Marivirga atlantica]